MKTLFTLAALAGLSLTAPAQKITKYFNQSSKPVDDPSKARYVSLIEFKNELWYRYDYFFPEKTMHLQGSYADSSLKVKHGSFISFHANKQLESKGRYENNRQQGLWLRYHENGTLSDSAVFANGKVVGLRLKWHPDGTPSDSIVTNADGTGVHCSWFDNGAPSEAGRYDTEGKKSGKWQFFHGNGQLSALEVYEGGRLQSAEYFDEAGKAVTDTAAINRNAEFKGGVNGWVRYLQKNLNGGIPVQRGASEGKYTVTVRFQVDVDGNTTEIKPTTKHGYGMEEEVVRLIRSGKWSPAMNHGRRVKAYRSQPVTFVIAQGQRREMRITTDRNSGFDNPGFGNPGFGGSSGTSRF